MHKIIGHQKCVWAATRYFWAAQKKTIILPACNIAMHWIRLVWWAGCGQCDKKFFECWPDFGIWPISPKFTHGKRKRDQPTDEIKQDKCRIHNQGKKKKRPTNGRDQTRQMSNPQPRLKKRPMNGRDRLDELGGNLTSRNFSTHLCPHKPTKFRFRLLSCLFPNFSFGQLSVRRIVLWGNFFVCFLLRSENKSSKPQNLLFVEEGGVGGECGPVGKAKRGRAGRGV